DLHYALSLDLFGSEVSTNAANFYNAGLKGRFQETKIDDDHLLTASSYPVLKMIDGAPKLVDEPALSAINMRLRDDYTKDCQGGINRWNKIIEKAGIKFEIKLPSVAFHRHIGEFASSSCAPDGSVLSSEECTRRRGEWLPNEDDGAFVESLMKPCYEKGKFASWIAPPKVGIDNKPGDFEYVRLN